MREILFRGKGIDGEWYEGCLHKATHEKPSGTTVTYNIQEFNYGYASEYDFDHTYTSGFDMMVHPETVGQYTGLTDKNGKKIFEGDIIKQSYYLGRGIYRDIVSVIEYGIGYAYSNVYGVTQRFRDGSGGAMLSVFDKSGGVDCEVIGNVYDNPELLKGE